jgi:integrase/recombinase XerD
MADDHRHIRGFLDMLAAERGAARNTLEAYMRDLGDYAAFLAARGRKLTQAARADISAYLQAASDALSPASLPSASSTSSSRPRASLRRARRRASPARPRPAGCPGRCPSPRSTG